MNKTLSDRIRTCKDGVIRNPYQGDDKKIVFVCTMGILRSATAARMYGQKYNTRSAGSAPDALISLSPNLIAWADELVFVNKENYENACERFGEHQIKHKAKVLNIPDSFPHMHPSLKEEFKEQYEDI